jgi:uncharacterized protein DUF5906
MDFFKIVMSEIKTGPRKGEYDIYPDFQVARFTDLMVKGKQFYAIWDEKKGLWSTDEYDVQRLVDEELANYVNERLTSMSVPYSVKWMRSNGSGSWRSFKNFISLLSDNSHELDGSLTFLNTEVKKNDFVSHRLPYALADGDCPGFDELLGTLYSVEERQKLEWALGSIVAGDSKTIQKFIVLYGAPGTGKGTFLDIVKKLFPGYITHFNAKSLGNPNDQFATEAFSNNPLVAIQADGDMSRLADNTKINTIVSHEELQMNAKWKPLHSAKVNAFLFMGTNSPVRITDAKSGLLRRLIDVNPTGVYIPEDHYHVLMAKVEFELGAIAAHCLKVYRKMGKNYYSGYRPTTMMLQTDVFFNYIEYHWDVFKEQDATTLSQAYALYKQYCSEGTIDKILPMYKFREELKNYFKEFKDRGRFNNADVRSLYTGFIAHPYKTPSSRDAHAFSLNLDQDVSLLDDVLADQLAVEAVYDEDKKLWRPKYKWKNVKTTLKDIDTSKLHYVKVPENFVVIDFDKKDSSGEKSLELNLEAASPWPATYGELSQGGNGVHLHYLYDGDVQELSAVHSLGIEIKTLVGDAALRRRVTRCNAIPVATLRQGSLPLREKPVLEDKTIQDERHLRNLIRRAINKDFQEGTKVNVEFIRKVTDEAYDQGMSYDISDLKPKIIAFANSASNQSQQALEIVTKIKWKSELVDEDAIMEEQPDKPHVIYDVEVYPNLFVICWKYRGAPEDSIVDMVNPTAQQVEEFVKNYRLEGFYVRRYDNHMLYARMLGYTNEQLFNLSQKIIVGNRNDALFGEAYNLSYADTWDYSSAANRKSLKKHQIDLGLNHMESNIPWDKPVPDELIPQVLKYCRNDVQTNDQVADYLSGDFKARQILAALSGLSVNHTTQSHTAKIIFGDDRNPQASFNYPDLSKEFPGYEFTQGKSYYRDEETGEGGYVYAEPGFYRSVGLLDVASMHPTSIRVLKLFGPYTKRFTDLVDARLAIKNGDLGSARKLLEGRLGPFLEGGADLKPLSDALKTVINIVYGLTAARFPNKFRDDRNKDNVVAKRGALFMIDLKHFIQEQGYKVIHIKTDSVKIPDVDDHIIEQVTLFGEKYGYSFEHEATYDKMLLANEAVYIAHDEKGWHATGAQFQEPFVFKTLFSGETPKLRDLAQLKQVTKGTMYLDFEYDRPSDEEAVIESMRYVGKSGLFYPVHEGTPGAGVLYRVSDEGKKYSVTGTKGFFWIEADVAETIGDELEIDYRYYDKLLDAAQKTIGEYVDVDEFTN